MKCVFLCPISPFMKLCQLLTSALKYLSVCCEHSWLLVLWFISLCTSPSLVPYLICVSVTIYLAPLLSAVVRVYSYVPHHESVQQSHSLLAQNLLLQPLDD